MLLDSDIALREGKNNSPALAANTEKTQALAAASSGNKWLAPSTA